MEDNTPIVTGNPNAGSPNSKRYSDSAVREAYRMLLDEFKNPEKTLVLVARSCRMSADEVKRILNSVAAAPEPAPAVLKVVPSTHPSSVPRKDATTRILKAPKPAAMLAFKQFALRDKSVNATILAAVQFPGESTEQASVTLEKNGFKLLPSYSTMNEAQQSILDYVAAVFDTHPARLSCGAKNVLVEGAEEMVGHISSPGIPVDEAHFEDLVAPLRNALAAAQPKAVLHYVSLPPLDLAKLQRTGNTMLLEKNGVRGVTLQEALIDEKFLRARSRDMVFVKWVSDHFPKGAPLDEVAAQIEFSDWLIALMAYTRFPPDTLDGKRMLVRLACLCAMRAQRWAPNLRARQALAAAERWVEDPSEEHRELVGKAHEELNQPEPPGDKPPPEGPEAYTRQAALESASRAVQAAHTTDPSRVRSHATRAAASAVMAASFAANAAQTTSWLEMVSSRAVPSETEEHRALCIAIRAMVDKNDA